MIQLEQLHDGRRPAFEQLLREIWQQTWADKLAGDIVRWRYYERPGNAVTWLAVHEDRCIAMLDSILRPYLFDGRRILVRETADWYCSPQWRPYGVGLWLLRQLTTHPEPVFVLGGSAHTVEILPKLRWQPLPPASSYVLPIKLRNLLGNAIRQRWWHHETWATTIPQCLPLRRPRHITVPNHGLSCRRLTSDDAVAVPVGRPGLVELFETEHWQWLARMPHGMAEPVGLLFLRDEQPVAVSMSQIEPTASGLDAKIVHLQLTEPSLGAWVVSMTCQMLADRGVGFIRCCVSSDDKIKALEQVGFIRSKRVLCHWLPRNVGIPTCLDVSYLRGDDAMPFQALRGRYVR